MFSTAQLDIIKPLVAQMRDKGYLYYLAVSNNATTITNDYDLFIYFSDEEISPITNYRYELPQSTIKYSIRSGNASTNNKPNRIDISYLPSATDLSIDSWQWVSTNAEFLTGMTMPDLTFTEVKSYETQGVTAFISTCMLVLVTILQFFRR